MRSRPQLPPPKAPTCMARPPSRESEVRAEAVRPSLPSLPACLITAGRGEGARHGLASASTCRQRRCAAGPPPAHRPPRLPPPAMWRHSSFIADGQAAGRSRLGWELGRTCEDGHQASHDRDDHFQEHLRRDEDLELNTHKRGGDTPQGPDTREGHACDEFASRRDRRAPHRGGAPPPRAQPALLHEQNFLCGTQPLCKGCSPSSRA